MSYQTYQDGQWVTISDDQMQNNLNNGWGWVTRTSDDPSTTTTTTSGGDSGGGGEVSSVEIPTGTYEYSKSSSKTGLPDWSTDYIKSWLSGINTPLTSALSNMSSYISDYKPFDWATNLNNNQNFFTDANSGLYNSLYDTLDKTLRNNTSSIGQSLNSSGLGLALPSAAPAIYRDALSSYTTNMANANTKAAEDASQLAQAMASLDTSQYGTTTTGFSDIVKALASLLGATQESTSSSITENPLQPYELMLSQWS